MNKPKLVLMLPWPPSVNGYWRSFRGRQILSKRAREYRREVLDLVKRSGSPRLEGPLRVNAYLHPPDRRKRDLDNYQKGVFDALCKAGVIEDDSMIRDLHLRWGTVTKGGLYYLEFYLHNRLDEDLGHRRIGDD